MKLLFMFVCVHAFVLFCLIMALAGCSAPTALPVKLVGLPESDVQLVLERLRIYGGEGIVDQEARNVAKYVKWPLDAQLAGQARQRGPNYCEFTLADHLDLSTKLNTILHEVGHCAGLGHSPRRASIMFKQTTALVWRGMFDDFFAEDSR